MKDEKRFGHFILHPSSFILSGEISRLVLYPVILICCAVPILWMAWQIAIHPQTWTAARLDAFRLLLIGRTILYNGLAALLATLLALPVAVVLGRGRGKCAGVMALLLPIGLFIPSIVYTYGWKQVFRLMHLDFLPAGPPDVARCIWTLATWLWPVPAGVIGLALRQVDANVQQAALLDGAYWRITARQLAAPIVAGFACAALLAMQEFSVYEPTGISVVATEVRMVFDTGAFSSPDNPITQPLGNKDEGGRMKDEVKVNPVSSFILPPSSFDSAQESRAAAAIVTGAPLLLIVGLLATIALLASRRWSVDDAIDPGPWPRALDARLPAFFASTLVFIVTLVIPMLGLILSLRRSWDMGQIWSEFGTELLGSLSLAALGGAGALLLAFFAMQSRPRGALVLALAGFLVGGQFLAIAQIHLYNRPKLGWVYNSPVIVVMTYLARFGWIALLAGRSTWSTPWRTVRDMAAVDGADRFLTTTRVIAPIAWPLLGATGLLMMVLCLGEVPATVLLQPMRPPMLIPLMMTWVHNLRFDPMIEASLLLVGVVAVLSLVVVLLTRLGRGRVKHG